MSERPPVPALPAAALLAGGLGTRIRTVGGTTPKVLLPVEGRPFIAHLLDYLARQGVTEAVLCLGYASDRVWEAAVGAAPPGLTLHASREDKPMGTGGAIRNALGLLGDAFLIVNGDTYLEASLHGLWRRHHEADALLTLTLVRSEQAAEKGTVKVDPAGRVLDFEEKTPEGTGLINAGIYAARARLFDRCPPDVGCSLEREVIPAALRAGERVTAVRVEGMPFVDIGLPEDYLRVRDRLPRPRGQR